MKKTGMMLAWERLKGRPLSALIAEAVNERGSVERAADEFGISKQTLYDWIYRLDGTLETTTSTRVLFPADEPLAA